MFSQLRDCGVLMSELREFQEYSEMETFHGNYFLLYLIPYVIKGSLSGL